MVDHLVNDGGPRQLLDCRYVITETDTLGRRIKTLRKARHLTQEQLAEGIGVVKQTISAWENDNAKNMTLRNLFALADALDSDPRYLALGFSDRLSAPPLRLSDLRFRPLPHSSESRLHLEDKATSAGIFRHKTNKSTMLDMMSTMVYFALHRTGDSDVSPTDQEPIHRRRAVHVRAARSDS